MTKRIKVLTDQEIGILKQVVDFWRKFTRGGGKGKGGPFPNQAPEVYIVRIPDGGIAKATRLGTGSPPTASVVTGVECSVYTQSLLYGSGTAGDENELEYAGFDITVYNVYPFRVSSGFSLAVRDKFGLWVHSGPHELRIYGKTKTDLTYGSSALIDVWRNELVTSPLETERVWFTWSGVAGQVIPAGTKVSAEWWADIQNGDGGWRIYTSNCVAS